MLIGIIPAIAIIVIVLIDAFEVVLLPRRVRHGFRLAKQFYQVSWLAGRTAARLLPPGRWRTGFLSTFGPLSLFFLIVAWALGLIVGFALLHWSLGASLHAEPPTAKITFWTYFYFSSTTFFTLGYGDLVPTGPLSRLLSVAESGTGYIFLAVVISYLPVLYQAFSRRETTIALMDARAGSPPCAGEFLRRLAVGKPPGGAGPFLAEWERWSADLLESHISFPVLSYYRSQHENQSWVATLTTILDASAVLITCVDGPDTYQARLTFAMARHAAVDLALVFQSHPQPPLDRLPKADFSRLLLRLHEAGMKARNCATALAALTELRALYEPVVNALAARFLLSLPPFQLDTPPVNNWQTSPWMARSPALGDLPSAGKGDDHFD